MTTLSDSICKKLGTVYRDSFGHELIANPRMELCGAFIGSMNVTLVGYKQRESEEKYYSSKEIEENKNIYDFSKLELRKAKPNRKYKNIK